MNYTICYLVVLNSLKCIDVIYVNLKFKFNFWYFKKNDAKCDTEVFKQIDADRVYHGKIF